MSIETHRKHFAHETETHRRVIESLRSVPEENRDTPTFHRAVDRFEHVLLARDLWLARLQGSADASIESLEGLFPEECKLGALDGHLDRVEQSWSAFFDELGDADSPFRYASFDGTPWLSSVGEVLTHVFTHGFYHRGQIATLVAQSGGTPAVQDYIFFAREEDPEQIPAQIPEQEAE